jgi:putative DNA methylase
VITEGENGKEYRSIEEADRIGFAQAASVEVERPNELILPEINAPDAEEKISNSTGIRVHLYGMKTWGSLFNPRQLVAMQTFLSCYSECLDYLRSTVSDEQYRLALITYLAMWISRNSSRMTTVGRWNISEETVATPVSVKGVPMKWDYPEANPTSNVSGGFANQTKYILSVILRESTTDGSLPCERISVWGPTPRWLTFFTVQCCFGNRRSAPI